MMVASVLPFLRFFFSRPCCSFPVNPSSRLLDRCSSTTSLVSTGTKGLNLVGLNEPEDEILEEPEQHLAMHARQRFSRHAGGEKPLQEAEAV